MGEFVWDNGKHSKLICASDTSQPKVADFKFKMTFVKTVQSLLLPEQTK
jgi:hypothetical protein